MINKILDFIVLDDDQAPVLNEQGLPQLLPRPDTKTTQDIERLIALNKPVEVINKFAELTSLGEQWDWAQSYYDYLVAKLEVEQYNANLPEPLENEEGELIEPEPKPLPAEPEQPAVKTVEDVLAPYARTIFKLNRQKLLDTLTVEVDGMVFDGDEASQSRMGRASFSMQDGETIPWVLANNEKAIVTKGQLALALRLAGAKQAEFWTE
ncbi:MULTISPECIES: hypothetical protein [unclassified Pseudoalteromonas]|uniref:hypothetical protein n=1 Tax=unclassified Pseudoalteromonas TaxID=194690 RepID=UPI0023599F38|nr:MULTISPECIES: hypothetical protein [unclassified Pseudoalteromonas]MDC9565556.1 hypothetical protein [Pseudoalteromonas sp. GAB2316C]MDC9569887.1 hypothetical protein [Pseudoalteromonas sp. GABNB9D]MDC9573998.1 hypothetical protein [Pseudoalteromonas sp. GABNS16A]MDC9578404.1 hypothetical protein [Pseudoalteromonas sp. GABNS16E]MDC9585978.1 hypothetical protein [Pseudoalteromonas sp. GABNS16C]